MAAINRLEDQSGKDGTGNELLNLVSEMSNLRVGNLESSSPTSKPTSKCSKKSSKTKSSTSKLGLEKELLDSFTQLSIDQKKNAEEEYKVRFKLRDYQQRLVHDVIMETEEKNVRSVLVYLPTGGGKTVVATHLMRRKVYGGKRCLFVVNRNALVDQTAAALEKCGIGKDEYGFIKSGYKMSKKTKNRLIQIASIQTFIRRSAVDSTNIILASTIPREDNQKYGKTVMSAANKGDTKARIPLEDLGNNSHQLSSNAMNKVDNECQSKNRPCGDFDLIILDEAHGAVANQYLQLVSMYPDAIKVGLSATPFRLNPNDNLGKVFVKGITGPTISELIERKILVQPVVFAPSTANFSSLKTCVARKESTIVSAVNQWKKYCNIEGEDGTRGLRTIVFCSSIAQSKLVVGKFIAEGIMAEHIDGNTKQDVRRAMVNRLRMNITTVISSVGVLSEGFDEPLVQALICLRPTESRGLYIQQIGRGLRCLPKSFPQEQSQFADLKKDICIILDEVGNTYKHGPVDGPCGTYTWESQFNSDDCEDEENTCSNTNKKDFKQKATKGKIRKPTRLKLCRKNKCHVLIHAKLKRCHLCLNKLENSSK